MFEFIIIATAIGGSIYGGVQLGRVLRDIIDSHNPRTDP